MDNSPSPVSEEQLEELHLAVIKEAEEWLNIIQTISYITRLNDSDFFKVNFALFSKWESGLFI
jgi:hypothetical protein